MDFQSLPDMAKRKTGLVQPSASTANLELLSFLCRGEEDTNPEPLLGFLLAESVSHGGTQAQS